MKSRSQRPDSKNDKIFAPDLLPPTLYYDAELINLLSEASSKIGKITGMTSMLNDSSAYFERYLRQEAVSSSRIQGAPVTLIDVLQHASIKNITKSEAKRLQIQQVLDYITTAQSIKKNHKQYMPITLDMIKDIHRQLTSDASPEVLKTVKYTAKQYDKKQISSFKDINDAMSNLIDFVNDPPENMHVLIQCAIVYYQFNAIGLFADWNGQVARILISLLLARDSLVMPLNLSNYFEKYSKEYQTKLEPTKKTRWQGWIKFFLRGIAEQSDHMIKSIQTTTSLQKEYKEHLKRNQIKGNAVLLLDALIVNPYITIPLAKKILYITYPSAKNAIESLVKTGILEEIKVIHKSRAFRATKIVEILYSEKSNRYRV